MGSSIQSVTAPAFEQDIYAIFVKIFRGQCPGREQTEFVGLTTVKSELRTPCFPGLLIWLIQTYPLRVFLTFCLMSLAITSGDLRCRFVLRATACPAVLAQSRDVHRHADRWPQGRRRAQQGRRARARLG